MAIGSVGGNFQGALPKINLGAPALKTTETKAPQGKTESKELSTDSAKEELAAAVASKLSDQRKTINGKTSSPQDIRKRVAHIEQIKEILNDLGAHEKEQTLSKQIYRALEKSGQDLSNFIVDALESGEEAAIIFLTMKKLEKSAQLSDDQRDTLGQLANELTSEKHILTSITASINVADVAAEHFKDNEMASQFRTLYGRGNGKQLVTSDILKNLFEAGKEENYDTLLKAYAVSMSKELGCEVKSTKLSYLVEQYTHLNHLASAESLLVSISDKMQMISNKFQTPTLSTTDFATLYMDFVSAPDQQSIETMAVDTVKFGSTKKAFFASQIYNLTAAVPTPVFESDMEKRNKCLDELLNYSSQHSTPLPGLQINKAFR